MFDDARKVESVSDITRKVRKYQANMKEAEAAVVIKRLDKRSEPVRLRKGLSYATQCWFRQRRFVASSAVLYYGRPIKSATRVTTFMDTQHA